MIGTNTKTVPADRARRSCGPWWPTDLLRPGLSVARELGSIAHGILGRQLACGREADALGSKAAEQNRRIVGRFITEGVMEGRIDVFDELCDPSLVDAAMLHLDGRTISVTNQPQTGLPLGGWDDLAGDGTVPSFCAMPIERSNDLPTGFLEQQRHGLLAALPTVSAWVRRCLGYPSLEATHGAKRPVVLGVELAQVLQPRRPNIILAEIRGVQDAPAEAIVYAEVIPCDNSSRPPLTVDLDWDGSIDTFRGVIPGLEPGLCDVTIVAEDVPGAGDLQTLETVEVVEDDDLD